MRFNRGTFPEMFRPFRGPLAAKLQTGSKKVGAKVVGIHLARRWKVKVGCFVFWATACKTVRPMLSDRCLSCSLLSYLRCLSCSMSVMLVYCGQTVG